MSDGTLKLSRVQLSKIADGDPEVIKQLENLFLKAAETNPDDIIDLQGQIDNLGLEALTPVVSLFTSILAGSNITVTQGGSGYTIGLALIVAGLTSLAATSISGSLSNSSGNLMDSSVAMTSSPGAGAGTLLNAPSAGNPTKWLVVNDNGTLRKVPAW